MRCPTCPRPSPASGSRFRSGAFSREPTLTRSPAAGPWPTPRRWRPSSSWPRGVRRARSPAREVGVEKGHGLGYAPLSPTAFLVRSMQVFPDRLAVVDGDRTLTYAELGRRSLALTGMLADLGVEPGDRVAALCSNSHLM